MRAKHTVALFHQGICSLFAKWLITRAANDALQGTNVFCKIVLFSDDLYLIKNYTDHTPIPSDFRLRSYNGKL